jgi:hypothetical protein
VSLGGCGRLATTAPFLQAIKMVHDSSKASPASMFSGRRWWVLLVLGVSFDSQENHRNHELKHGLGFQFLDEKLMPMGPPFIGVLVPNHKRQRS